MDLVVALSYFVFGFSSVPNSICVHQPDIATSVPCLVWPQTRLGRGFEMFYFC